MLRGRWPMMLLALHQESCRRRIDGLEKLYGLPFESQTETLEQQGVYER